MKIIEYMISTFDNKDMKTFTKKCEFLIVFEDNFQIKLN